MIEILGEKYMLTVGDKFPAFQLQGVNSDNELVEVSVEENYEPLKKDWSVIYFYPKDFTFICPTEIAAMDKLVDEATVIGISGDNEFCKLAWKNDNSLIGDIKHSLAADTGLSLSNELGVVNVEEGVCYRATFIIDDQRTIQHVSVNALDTGRNADEVLRTLKALKAGGLTGCSWAEGDDFVA
jgi:Peroxiredoxin